MPRADQDALDETKSWVITDGAIILQNYIVRIEVCVARVAEYKSSLMLDSVRGSGKSEVCGNSMNSTVARHVVIFELPSAAATTLRSIAWDNFVPPSDSAGW